MRLQDKYIRLKDLFDMTAKDFAELFNAIGELSPSERREAIRGDYYEMPE